MQKKREGGESRTVLDDELRGEAKEKAYARRGGKDGYEKKEEIERRITKKEEDKR